MRASDTHGGAPGAKNIPLRIAAHSLAYSVKLDEPGVPTNIRLSDGFSATIARRSPTVLLYSSSVAAQSSPYMPQILPPAKRAARVGITQGPELELATSTWAIVRWTSNNPGGSDEHYGVVKYGTNAGNLTGTAQSHIRLNQNHSYTAFRVRIDGLKPQTTYYYRVDSMAADGSSDGVKSPVGHFTTR